MIFAYYNKLQKINIICNKFIEKLRCIIFKMHSENVSFVGISFLLYHMVSIVIEHEKSYFWSVFFFFFEISQKQLKNILIKKIVRNHGILVYKKAFMSEHRKNYIFRDINCFVKMPVSTLVRACCVTNFLWTL